MKRIIRSTICGLLAFFLSSGSLFAAKELLKTPKLKIGEKVPMTESLTKAHEEGKIIVLLLRPAPIACVGCDSVTELLREELAGHEKASLIVKGGQGLFGAPDKENIKLKRLFGFVTMGEPWTFVIDQDGILRKIFIGRYTKQELEKVLEEVMVRKADAVKEFVLTVTEGNIELNGANFMVFTFNGTVPGPEIRVKEGDRVRFTLRNKSGAKHGLFFHGLHVTPQISLQEQKIAVSPGHEFTFAEFVAKPAGTHLYHCSFNMAEHLSRGLYGAFIVESKEEKKTDREFVYILSDWNSKAAKGGGHYEIGNPMNLMGRDITTINNRAVTGDNPTVMDVKEGETVRIRLANIGFIPHKIRFPEGFLITHEDGYPIFEPRKHETLNIYPGKRHDLLLTAGKPGRYAFYHSIRMPPSAQERLMENQSTQQPAADHGYWASESSGSEIQNPKAAAGELPIIELNVN